MNARCTTLVLALLMVASFFVGSAAAHEKKYHVEWVPVCAPPSGSTFHGHAGPASFTIGVCHPNPPLENLDPRNLGFIDI